MPVLEGPGFLTLKITRCPPCPYLTQILGVHAFQSRSWAVRLAS